MGKVIYRCIFTVVLVVVLMGVRPGYAQDGSRVDDKMYTRMRSQPGIQPAVQLPQDAADAMRGSVGYSVCGVGYSQRQLGSLAEQRAISRGRIPLWAIDGGSRHQVALGVGFMPIAVETMGTIGLDYYYRVNRTIQVGAAISVATWWWGTQDYVFMPSVRFNWLNSPLVNIYSGLSLGVLCSVNSNAHSTTDVIRERVKWNFTGQFMPFGIVVGRKVYGFAEVFSYGALGVVRAGVGFRFGYTRGERGTY